MNKTAIIIGVGPAGLTAASCTISAKASGILVLPIIAVLFLLFKNFSLSL